MKKSKIFSIIKVILGWLMLSVCLPVFSETPLTPLILDSPRNSLRNFLKNMNLYREGVIENNTEKIDKINLAVKSLNLKEMPPLLRNEEGKEVAIYLKETIDRVYVFSDSYEEIPSTQDISFWNIPDTEITIQSEDVNGRKIYLFNPSTVVNAKEYFLKTKHLSFLKGSGMGANYVTPWRERVIPNWTTHSLLGLHLWQWIGLGLAVIFSYFIKFISKYLFDYTLKLAKKTIHTWDEDLLNAISKSGGNIIVIGFWFVFLYLTGIEGKTYIIISYTLKIFLGIYFVMFLNDLSNIIGNLYKYKLIDSENSIDLQLIPFLTKTTKVILISLGIMISLQNLGINVVSLLAGLGIGGLAIALAARDTAANLFGSLMILLDKPFKIGDYIIIGSAEGRVEEIGFRSTQIRSLSDSIITIPNAIVANSNIENSDDKRFRRTNFTLYVSYETKPSILEIFLEGINLILDKNILLKKEDMTANLTKLGEPGIEISVNFYSKSPDWYETLEIRQNIYLEILSLASELNISIVTQTKSFEPIPGEISNEQIEKLIEKINSFGANGKMSKPNGLGIYKAIYKKLNL